MKLYLYQWFRSRLTSLSIFLLCCGLAMLVMFINPEWIAGMKKITQISVYSVGNQICDYNGVAVDLNHARVNNAAYDSAEEYVLVTGGAGFIGSRVAEITASFDPNTTVIIIDDLSGGFISNIPGNKNIIFEQGSLLNESFVDAIFEKYDRIKWIYHLAAYASVGLSHHIPVYNYENNQIASIRLINCAINYNVSQFIFTSSINIYGSGPYKGFEGEFTEEMPGYPQDPYGVSKHSVEAHLEIVRNYYGLNYTIFRPHAVYGPNQNIFDRYRNVIGIFMYSLLNSEPMKIFGDGQQRRSFSYIEDVAPYIALSPFYPHLLNNKFNIGSHQTTTLDELASVVIKVFIFENKLINHKQLMIFEEYNKIKHKFNDDKEAIINYLFNNDRIVQHITQRNEVMNAQASHSYFNCMFKVNISQITDLEVGINKTLDWVVTNDIIKLKHFHQIRFDSIEVSKNLPPSWTDPNHAIRISPIARPHMQHTKHRSSVTIIQSDNRNITHSYGDSYLTLTVLINYLYALKHGYQYVYYQWVVPPSPDPKAQQVCGGRSASWCKLPCVYHALTVSKPNDFVLFIDSDAAFKFYNKSIEHYLRDERGYAIYNQNASIITAHDYPWNPLKSNAGIFFTKNNALSKIILKSWWNCKNEPECFDFFNKHDYEQRYFQTEIQKRFAQNISVLNDHSMAEGEEKMWKHVVHGRQEERIPKFTKLLHTFLKTFESDHKSQKVNVTQIINAIRAKHTIFMHDNGSIQKEMLSL